MIKKGEVFQVIDDDGYHQYPQGHFIALRDIRRKDVEPLLERSLEFPDILVERGLAKGVGMQKLWINDNEVGSVGSLSNDARSSRIVGNDA